ncbi:uncharacterized protein METZ01_LOCUS13340, partial [marine metagenome]
VGTDDKIPVAAADRDDDIPADVGSDFVGFRIREGVDLVDPAMFVEELQQTVEPLGGRRLVEPTGNFDETRQGRRLLGSESR